jgi:hypothetical protein
LITKAHNNVVETQREITRYNTEEVLKKINELVNSNDAFEKAVGLSLASGCRPIELFNKNVHFTDIGDNWVHQSFVAKKRNDAIVPVDKPIVGISVEKFIAEVDEMRGTISLDIRVMIHSNGKLNNEIEKACNKITKEVFDYAEGITFYSCRKIYGNLSYDLFAKGGKYGPDPTINYWLSKVLKHGENDIETAFHYNTFRPNDETKSATQIAELKAKIESLEKIINEKTVFTVEKPIKLSIKDSKREEQFKKIKEVFEKEKPATQTQLENLMSKIVPRIVVRQFWKKNL